MLIGRGIFEIDEFVEKQEIDELYMRDPYYIIPDGEVGQQAFAVIREAIRKEGTRRPIVASKLPIRFIVGEPTPSRGVPPCVNKIAER